MDKKLLITLAKVDEAKQEVWGIATEEKQDCADEIMDYASSAPYFKSWSENAEKRSNGKSKGNLRYMHQLDAVGKLIDIQFDDEAKQIRIGAKVVDKSAWEKVVEGVLNSFSIGGKYVKTWLDPISKELTRFTCSPSEISLVDCPCLPTAVIEFIKADGSVSYITPKLAQKKGGILFHYGIKNGKSEVQSVLFDKDSWTKEEAKAWLKENDYSSSKSDESDNYYHFTQHDPGKYDSIRTGKPGDKTIGALMTKDKKTKRVDGEDLTSGDFIIVLDPDDPETWKLPWKFSSQDKTVSHLRNALARFNQMTDVPEDVRDKAYEKLKRLASEHGIEVSDSSKALADIALHLSQPESVKSALDLLDAAELKFQVRMAKSMYDVADLACLLVQIRSIMSYQKWEADMEDNDQDNYAIADALGKWLSDGVEILKDLVDEETSELTAA